MVGSPLADSCLTVKTVKKWRQRCPPPIAEVLGTPQAPKETAGTEGGTTWKEEDGIEQ